MAELDITISIDRDGEVKDVQADTLGNLRHTLDDPDSPVSRLHAGKQKKTDIDPSIAPSSPRLGMEEVTSTHLASVAMPSEVLIGGGRENSIQITDDQMAEVTRKHEIDAYTKGALSILTPEKTKLSNTEHLQKIEQAVHAVMQQVLGGMDLLRIPPAEIFRLVDTLRDHAFAYASNCASTGTPPCVDTLKNQMRNHRDVQNFVRKHNPGVTWGAEDAYCPQTGQPRHHVCTSSISHHGHVEELERHHNHGHGHHH